MHGAQIMGSEVGVVDIPNWDIASKGRLMPGNIFLVDFDAKRVIKDDEVPPPSPSRNQSLHLTGRGTMFACGPGAWQFSGV